jgi:hypothetical protein
MDIVTFNSTLQLTGEALDAAVRQIGLADWWPACAVRVRLL